MLSYNSQADFASRDQTIIIFDWDDTLCPSSAIRKMASFDDQGHLKAKLDANNKRELKLLAEQVNAVVNLASSLGKVILVTNAKRPWVETSSDFFAYVQVFCEAHTNFLCSGDAAGCGLSED